MRARGEAGPGTAEPDIIEKELEAAESDLKSAEASVSVGNFKWATVQAYYSMFHTAKALVLHRGYREKSHQCLSIALRALLPDAVDARHFDNFRDCMALRQDADYGLVYSESSAKGAVRWAKDFLEDGRGVIRP